MRPQTPNLTTKIKLQPSVQKQKLVTGLNFRDLLKPVLK